MRSAFLSEPGLQKFFQIRDAFPDRSGMMMGKNTFTFDIPQNNIPRLASLLQTPSPP
jgi:hypothetical protein